MRELGLLTSVLSTPRLLEDLIDEVLLSCCCCQVISAQTSQAVPAVYVRFRTKHLRIQMQHRSEWTLNSDRLNVSSCAQLACTNGTCPAALQKSPPSDTCGGTSATGDAASFVCGAKVQQSLLIWPAPNRAA